MFNSGVMELTIIICSVIASCYAPNFEEVWEAYWFGPVRPSHIQTFAIWLC